MDYEWFYYVGDLKNGIIKRPATGNRGSVSFVRYRLQEEKLKQCRNVIKGMLIEYRNSRKEDRLLIEELMKAHAEYIRLLPENELLKASDE